MSLPTALALLSLLVSAFAVLAVGAVYARLRLLERTALNPHSALLADEVRTVPAALWPQGDQQQAVVLQLNDSCALCHLVWEAASEDATIREAAGTRIMGLFASSEAASSFPEASSVEIVVDADAWAAMSEGYTPCVFRIDNAGRVADRRFVYRDTDLPALLAQLVPVPEAEPARSSRAL
ncbi:hypothetical protein [Micromonospora deserti]|uniref:Thioredoxin domain-containing protein n=1 Tax=Micromonospora deserti TaxID=2070366 RepID=A0A2W2ECG0_9ACTN|nr:hypothetical protein [Micromonospora deserti]PZG02514.1 hypothetical protein C1I99_02000 [Micromonospora deserti]